MLEILFIFLYIPIKIERTADMKTVSSIILYFLNVIIQIFIKFMTSQAKFFMLIKCGANVNFLS